MILQSEIMWIVITIIITSITIFFSIYYSSIFSTKTQETFRFSIFDDLALKSLSNLYIAKSQTIEKTYLQMAIDSLLYLKRYKISEREKIKQNLKIGEIVYYGIALGAYNISDFIYPLFDNTIGSNRWQLIIYYNESLYHIHGYNLTSKILIKSYILPIPIPDGEIGYLIFRVV